MRLAPWSLLVLSFLCVELVCGAKQNQPNGNKKKVAWDPKSKLKAKPDVYIDDNEKSERVPEGSGSGTPVPTDMDVESSGLGPDDEDALAKSWGSGGGSNSEDDEDDDEEEETEAPTAATSAPAPTEPHITEQTETASEPDESNEVTDEWTPPVALTTSTSTETPTEATTRQRFVPTYRPIETTPAWMAFTDAPVTEPPTQEWTTTSSIYESTSRRSHGDLFFNKPGILAAVIGGAIVGLLAAILIVMFIVYRMRKKDEGSYALEEPKSPQSYPYAYHKAPAKEFYA